MRNERVSKQSSQIILLAFLRKSYFIIRESFFDRGAESRTRTKTSQTSRATITPRPVVLNHNISCEKRKKRVSFREFALVVQWTELRTSKPAMEVRFLPRAPTTNSTAFLKPTCGTRGGRATSFVLKIGASLVQ